MHRNVSFGDYQLDGVVYALHLGLYGINVWCTFLGELVFVRKWLSSHGYLNVIYC